MSYQEYVRNDGEGSRSIYGLCDGSKRSIDIGTSGVAPDVQDGTLLHETVHAIFRTVASSYPEDEETIVDQIECGGMSIFRDERNHWFVERLLGPGWEVRKCRSKR